MNSGESSYPRTRSGVVGRNPTVKGGSNNEPAAVKGLPDGWLKEYRPRKQGSGSKIKSDPIYIDPSNGYEFRSLKDVHRYLESGDISKCSTRPRKRNSEDLHTTGNQNIEDLHTEGNQSIEDLHTTGNQSHAGTPSQPTRVGTADKSIQCDLITIEGDRPLREALVDPDRVANTKNVLSPKPESTNLVQSYANKVEALEYKSVLPVSSKHSQQETESVECKGPSVDVKHKEKKRKVKTAKQKATPIRASPRLAALRSMQEEIDEPEDEPVSIKTVIANRLQPNQAHTANQLQINQENIVYQLQLDQPENPKPEASFSSVSEQKDGKLITSSLKEVETQGSFPVEIGGALIASPSINVECQDALVEEPVLPKQDALVEPAADLSGSALSSLFAWSDPCIEFAFKTLTGDIPVLDDTAAVADYFHQQQDSNKGTMPNCSSTAYDGTKKHSQGDHVNLPMPRQSDKFYNGSWFPPQ